MGEGDQPSLDADEWRELVRQARQMQTAYEVIHQIHGELSLGKITEGVVQSLVDIGGLTAAEISLDATLDGLHVKSAAQAGVRESDDRSMQFPVLARGAEVGMLTVHYTAEQNE